tara:strand:+ start:3534 stop:4460 length:927 start_codon:yes stop_codon:yes gene_type:complete
VVFSFSYFSLINGKTYDLFWVKSIQKKIYFRGYRNIWQYNKKCTSYDENLLYKPKTGKCKFNNPEFSTHLTFDKISRTHNLKNNYNPDDDYILVLGDSIAMGWGVNDNETFSFLMETNLKKKVYNLGVSSYGTTREIKKMKFSPLYNDSKKIIIQYHPNDLHENIKLDYNKIYSKKEYNDIYESTDHQLNSIKFILKNFKTSIRLFFSDIIDILFREANLEKINFDEHKKYLEKIIKERIDVKNKEVIVFLVIAPYQKVINFPEYNNEIKYLLIKLDDSEYFVIDEHPNSKGHLKIAKKLLNLLDKEE